MQCFSLRLELDRFGFPAIDPCAMTSVGIILKNNAKELVSKANFGSKLETDSENKIAIYRNTYLDSTATATVTPPAIVAGGGTSSLITWVDYSDGTDSSIGGASLLSQEILVEQKKLTQRLIDLRMECEQNANDLLANADCETKLKMDNLSREVQYQGAQVVPTLGRKESECLA